MKDTYRLLALSPASPSPWASWEQQHSALQATLARVCAMKAQGCRPVVEIDLDLTSLLAVEKAAATLQDLAPRTSELAEHLDGLPPQTREQLCAGLKELWKDPASAHACLPGYTDGAIAGYGIYIAALLPTRLGIKLEQAVEERLAEWVRTIVYASLRNGYWDRDLLDDQISPGFVDFLVELYRRGGEAVFMSNRPPSTREKSLTRLTMAVSAAGQLLKNDPTAIPLFGYFGPGGSQFDSVSKQVAQHHLEQNPPPGVYYAQIAADGTLDFGQVTGQGSQIVVTAVFDDRMENRRAIVGAAGKSTEALQRAGYPEICAVAMATIWHSAEVEVTDATYVVASFEWNRSL